MISLLLIVASSGSIAGAMPVPVPQIQTSQCGNVISSLNSNIAATYVAGATAYRFRVVHNGQENIIERTTRSFKLTMLPSTAFGRTYQVSVAVKYQGIWQPYGPVCSVSTPTPLTKIQTSQCGITLNGLTQVIYANPVAYATGYRFRIIDVMNPGNIRTIDRTVREFRMNLVPGIESQTVYVVDVAVKNLDGSYLPYGEQCQITTPVLQTRINPMQCGAVLQSLQENLYVTFVSNATGYRFKITDPLNPAFLKVVDRANGILSLITVSGITYERTYSIEVAIRQSNGTYLPYGQACSITTSKMPTPKIQLAQCDLVAESMSDLIYADQIAGATKYRFRLQKLGYSQARDRSTRNYSLSLFTGLEPNTEYTVRVSVMVNGVFTPYGKACTVVTPPNATENRMSEPVVADAETAADELSAVAFPNPFTETFGIVPVSEANETVSIKVFDMMGRTLENRTMTSADCRSMRFGSAYPPGIYTLLLNDGSAEKVLRMVKR